MKCKSPYNRLLLRVTRRCNLCCPECKVKNFPPSPDMTWKQLERFVTRSKELGRRYSSVIFTGGEPTLWGPLADATRFVKAMGVTEHVRVLTNGMKRGLSIEDFGVADRIVFSDYGALNRHNYRILKKQDRRRVSKTRGVHLPLDIQEAENSLPAWCACVAVTISGDRVYPCTEAELHNVNGCSVEDDFVAHLAKINPFQQELCRTCFTNLNNRADRSAPLVFEAFVWESPIGITWSLPWRLMWLRRLRSKSQQKNRR